MLRATPPIDRGSLELVTAPATEPVTRDEAKVHCRIETTADDAYIDSLIVGARELVERITRRALITQTWRLVLDNWPGSIRDDWWDGVREGTLSMVDSGEVEIRKGGFIAVTKVETIAEDATATEWVGTGNYYSVTKNSMGRLVKYAAAVWPLIVLPVRQRGGIVITFTAGYGTSASSVPMGLRQAIKDIVLHWYEVRGAAEESSRFHVPMKTGVILKQFEVGR
jgi:hypothetical protein